MEILNKWLENPNAVGGVALLVLAVASFVKGWIVPKWSYDAVVTSCSDLKKERDEFKAMALRNVDLTDRALGVALQKKVEP